MQQNLSVNLERKIATNRWVIKIRWVYMVGVFFIGFLTKTLSRSNVDFSFAAMTGLFVAFAAINLALYFAQKRLENNFSPVRLVFISYFQVIIELVFFTIIMHLAGGVESISTVFFFLPVVSASLIFGSRGAILTAIASSLLINLLVIAEYYGIVSHVFRYGAPTIEFQSLPIAITKTVATSVFYLIVGSFSGYGANMLFKREKSFEEKVGQLNEQAKKLYRREKDLTAANQELDDKVAELEKFQKQAVGRELKMIELKNKIKELENKLNIK